VRGAALPDEPDDNIAHIGKKVIIDRFDITEADACRKILMRARPDYLFHLAAVSSVGQSFSMGDRTFRVNVYGTHNILEAIRRWRNLRRILIVSSSDVYGPVGKDDLPLRPTRLLNPVSPYAQSKAAAEYLARTYIDQYQLPVIVVRAFNHSGPRQNSNFVIPAFCRKIVEAERSRRKYTIGVGNLSARRDISDVRDIVRGYRLVAEKGAVGNTYHLCSGKAYRIGELLNRLIALSDTPIKVTRDSGLIRKTDIPALRGSYHSTRRDTGWRPQMTIATTLADTMQYWREHLT
jgi:GDP-4-dehydro-6-deoxy-D-mannose reductase